MQAYPLVFQPIPEPVRVTAPVGDRLFGGRQATHQGRCFGLIADLAVWFGLRVLFGHVCPVTAVGLDLDLPIRSTLDVRALGAGGLAEISDYAV